MAKSKSFPKPDPYFVGPKSDFFFIGGLSLILFPLLYLVSGWEYFSEFLTAVFFAQLVVNYPHFSATVFRLYRSKDNYSAFPVTSFVLPFVILLLTLAALMSPAFFASIFIMIYFFWSPYHFSGQSSGVTMVYARRNNFMIGKIERCFLSGFIFSSFLLPFTWVFSNSGENALTSVENATTVERFFGSAFYSINLPEWVQFPIFLFLIVCALGFLWRMIEQANDKGLKFPPFMIFLPAVTHFVWFFFSARIGAFAFIALVPLFHSLQYLYIAWAVQLREKYSDARNAPTKKQVKKDTLEWYGYNVLGGVTQFIILPAIASNIFNLPFIYAFLIISIGVQVHHFFVDGVIWKLRNPNALSALTSNVPKWVKP
jgi:hypothetical protein